MVERIDSDPLYLILKAASDPTRRAILTHLAQEGPTRVTEIAQRFDMSPVSYTHLDVYKRQRQPPAPATQETQDETFP